MVVHLGWASDLKITLTSPKHICSLGRIPYDGEEMPVTRFQPSTGSKKEVPYTVVAAIEKL